MTAAPRPEPETPQRARTGARRIAGVGWSVLQRLSPQWAGRAAFKLFCTPPSRKRRTPAERRALDTLSANLKTATARRVMTPDADVQTYRWSAHTAPYRGCVLLVHGWTAEARIMTLFVEPLRRAGFDVVAIDLPAHGRASGRRLNMPIGARAVLAVEQAEGPFTGVIAHSFGGLVAVHAAEGGAPLTRALSIDRLVLISTPHSLSRLVRDFGTGLGFNAGMHQALADAVSAAALRPVTSISTGGMLAVAARPTLVIQDDDDDIVPASDGPAIVAATPAATLMTTKGLGHRRIVVMPTIVRASVRFLKGEAP